MDNFTAQSKKGKKGEKESYMPQHTETRSVAPASNRTALLIIKCAHLKQDGCHDY